MTCRTSSSEGSQPLSVLSYDPDRKAYDYFSIDNAGMVSNQRGALQGEAWTFTSDTQPTMRIEVKPSTPSGFKDSKYIRK